MRSLSILLMFAVAAIHFSGSEAAAEDAGGGPLNDLVQLPVNLLRFVTHLVGLPFKVPAKLLEFLTKIVVTLEHFGASELKEVISLVNQLVGTVLDNLVAAGVLGGKTVEDVLTLIETVLTKAVVIVWSTATKTTSFVVDGLLGIFGKVKSIGDLIEFLERLPVISNLVRIVAPIKTFVLTTYKNQTEEALKFIHQEVEKHSDFFEPILNGTATRILIVANALQALVDGDLEQCSGNVSSGSGPAGTLRWKVDVLIGEVKVILLRLLGFAKLADDLELDIDNELNASKTNATTN